MENTAPQQTVEAEAPDTAVNHVVTDSHPPNVASPDSHEAQGGRGKAVGGISLLVLVGLAIFYGVHSRTKAEGELTRSTAAAAIPSVNITHPAGGTAAQEIVLPGNTQAFTDTPIYARTNGYLRRWYVDIGAHVRKGQLIAEIETPELDQQLQQAEADMKTAEANMHLAQTTSVRWQGLLGKNAVSKQETDQMTSDYAARQATYAASQANVRRLKELQGYERVIAPFDGTITARNTDIGALISGSGTSTGGSAMSPHELFHLDSVGRLRVYASVPEVYADSVRDGAKVSLTQDADPTKVITGTISTNSSAIDPMSRTLNVEVDVDNANGQLRPGAYVFVRFKLPASSHAVTIPSNALLFRAEGLRVGVVRDGVVQLTPITIGQDFGNSVEVTSGLTPSDTIVLDPSDSLTSGTKVEVNATQQKGTA
jgi:RND family efflux transporter MFP subunit